jgi:hypothetical protein
MYCTYLIIHGESFWGCFHDYLYLSRNINVNVNVNVPHFIAVSIIITVCTVWGAIEQQHQQEMGRNKRRENASRISHNYKVEDKVLLKKQVSILEN